MKTPTGLLLLFLALLIYLPASAQSVSEYEKKTFPAKNGHELPYRILYPKGYDQATSRQKQRYPLILVLHGAGERGSDNEKQLTHGARLFLTEENRTNFPAVVIFPQCPSDSYWASVKIDRNAGEEILAFAGNSPAGFHSGFFMATKTTL